MGRMTTGVAARLKEAARKAGMTADQVAEAMNMSPAAIRHWWTARNNPSIDQVDMYAAVTGTSAWWLWMGKEDPAHLYERIAQKLDLFREEVFGGSWEAVIGDEGPGPTLRERLAADAGAAWLELSDEDRRSIVEFVHYVAQFRRLQTGSDQSNPARRDRQPPPRG